MIPSVLVLIASLIGIFTLLYKDVISQEMKKLMPEALIEDNPRRVDSTWPNDSLSNPAEAFSGGEVDMMQMDLAKCPPVDLEEDTFGIAVCSLVRDMYYQNEHGFRWNRALRMFGQVFLVMLTIGTQIFILSKVKQLVVAGNVHDIRESYSAYELAIYTKEHVYLNANQKYRGYKEWMPPLDVAVQRLNTMNDDDRESACKIPLSQPAFFFFVLLLWSLIVLGELRRATTLQMHITMLDTVESMDQSMKQEGDPEEMTYTIIGMTRFMKICITVLMFIPRMAIALYLLYVGCRFLLATSDFEGLILNAVALEFILLIKDLFYMSLVPARSHIDLSLTKINPYPKRLSPHWYNFATSFVYLGVTVIWVWFYMYHFQSVLPEYQWDVHEVCVKYIEEATAVIQMGETLQQ